MKRFITYLSLLLCVALLAVGAAPTLAAAKVKTTASATAAGFDETVTVTVTVTDGVLTNVTATSTSKSDIGRKALEQLPKAMVSKNSVSVDTVSGATGTSKAVLSAARLTWMPGLWKTATSRRKITTSSPARIPSPALPTRLRSRLRRKTTF